MQFIMKCKWNIKKLRIFPSIALQKDEVNDTLKGNQRQLMVLGYMKSNQVTPVIKQHLQGNEIPLQVRSN